MRVSFGQNIIISQRHKLFRNSTLKKSKQIFILPMQVGLG
jgi:hypothetical protein